ncbi:MAG: phospholipase D family protein [Chloroflexi bacterium]|nr:phospholipase D family protein [Chloroflexota bacterium]
MTMVPQHTPHPNVIQGDFFGELFPLHTRVIKQQKDFDSLFDGFGRMRAISYVISPDLLLEFFDKRGYSEVEVVVGENLSETYKKNLEQKGIEVTDQLADLVEKDKLRVFISARTIHTKLYILERDEIVRVIQTSANLTLTAQEARQINYAWYFDIPRSNPVLKQLEQDYESHLRGCTLFMEDLKNLLKQRPETDRKQSIEVWLKGAISEEQDMKIRDIFHDLSLSLVEASDAKEEKITVLQLPESGVQRKRVEKLLKPLNPVSAGHNQMQINTPAYVRYVYETHHVPLLILSRERQELLFGLDTPMTVLTQAPPDANLVNQGLELMEAYLNTVDFGVVSADPAFVKRSVFEALLYIFFTPFAHECMKARRVKFGPLYSRGPRFLYIYGPSQNGKSTFLRFALKLLTGRIIEPLSRQDFTKTGITNVRLTETAFPLVFDDVDQSRILRMEEVFKSYWERWWRDQYVSPQIVITSNSPRLREWAKSRVKRIDFDVQFAPSEAARGKLARLFKEDNLIFRWFSYLYLNRLNADELASDDELLLARAVMRELYAKAKRSIPEFFPAEPIEKLYDPGRQDWRDLLYGLHKATVKDEGNRKLVTFAKDMQLWEIIDYQGYLPQTIKYQRKGNTIIIENPKEFDKWLGQPPKTGMLSRIFKNKES